MREEPIIKKVEVIVYESKLSNVGKDYNTFNMVYEPNSTLTTRNNILRIHTSNGLIGQYDSITDNALSDVKTIAQYLIGKNALSRESIYNDTKRGLRHTAMLGVGVVDICLWDIAGKLYDEPIYKLLGGEKKPLPCYASTLHADENGGLSSAQDFLDFAIQCREMGYPAFKVHGWGNARDNLQREIDNVLNLGSGLNNSMDLMIDPACEIKNFSDTIKLGRACDEANFFWYEDPFQDGGVSQFAHAKLRQLIKTPILQTEHIRLLEQHVDFINAGATDFVRAGAHEDGGITGAMKIAHASEGFGLDVELHGPGAVHRHIMSSIRNTNYFELGLVHPNVEYTKPQIYTNYSDNLDAIDSNGNVFAPDGPGIGVDLDWEWIKKNQVDGGILAE